MSLWFGGDLNLAQAYVNNLYEECFEGWSVSADQNSDQVTGIPLVFGYDHGDRG